MVVCAVSTRTWAGTIAARNDMMVIIVPVALGQSEGGGVRAGHSLLLSQARAEQLLFPAAALLHYNNPIPSPCNSLRTCLSFLVPL